MLGSLGVPELLIIAIVFALPVGVLWKVAVARGQSRAYAFWGILGWLGLIIGLLMMVAMPRRSRR